MNEAKELIPQSIRSMIKECLNFWESIQNIQIGNDAENDAAAANLSKLSTFKTELVDERKKLTKPFKDPANVIEGEFRPAIEKTAHGIKQLKLAMGKHELKKENARKALARKLALENEERQRKADEKAAAELKKADEYKKQGRDHMAAQAEARAQGHIETSEQSVASEVIKPKVAGTSFKKCYEVKVEDLEKAILDCMTRQDTKRHVKLDEKGLADLQKTYDGELKIQGVRFIERRTVSSRKS